jgi:hypothetical protein
MPDSVPAEWIDIPVPAATRVPVDARDRVQAIVGVTPVPASSVPFVKASFPPLHSNAILEVMPNSGHYPIQAYFRLSNPKVELESIVFFAVDVHAGARRLHIAADHVQAVADDGAGQPVTRYRQ